MSIPLEPAPTLDEAGTAATAPAGGWRNPGGGYLFFLGFAAIGAGMGSLTPAVLTIALKAAVIAPDRATEVLAVTAGVAGLAGLISFPVLGRISDRTTSRLGRRRPFLILGSVLFAIGGLGILLATSVPVLVLSNLLTSVGYSSTLMAATATIADQVEPRRRGPASAVVGLSLPVGALLGLFVAQAVSPNLALEIALPALFAVVGAAVLAVRLTDRRLAKEERSPFGWRQFPSTFWVNPARHPNFAWAWISRLLVFMGVTALQAYQVYYLISVLDFTEATVPQAIFISTLVLTGVALLFAPVAAKISDVVGRRKPFVIIAAVVFAVGLAMAAYAQSYTAFLVATAVVGLGQGVYFAVDVALVTQVLPDPENPGKDLGLMNLANTLPFAIVPLGAPLVLAIGATGPLDQNYTLLFLLGAGAGLLGAVLILPIRRVR